MMSTSHHIQDFLAGMKFIEGDIIWFVELILVNHFDDVPKLKVLDLYVWLSFRLEDSFPDRDLASSQKAICSMWVKILGDLLIVVFISLPDWRLNCVNSEFKWKHQIPLQKN